MENWSWLATLVAHQVKRRKKTWRRGFQRQRSVYSCQCPCCHSRITQRFQISHQTNQEARTHTAWMGEYARGTFPTAGRRLSTHGISPQHEISCGPSRKLKESEFDDNVWLERQWKYFRESISSDSETERRERRGEVKFIDFQRLS